MILSKQVLFDENPCPTEEGVRGGVSGNVCHCTGYVKMVQAILAVAVARK